MKIVHVCLANIYQEGMGYQENLLCEKHKALGYDVVVISTFKKNIPELSKIDTIEDDIKLIRLPQKVGILGKRLNMYQFLYRTLVNERPDIIFVHGAQFGSVNHIIKYIKHNKVVRLFIDNHTDYINTPADTWKRKIWYRYVTGHFVRKLSKYAVVVWGTTPLRMEYLKKVYKIPEKKIQLLVMGGDEAKIDLTNKSKIRAEYRLKLGIKEDDFVAITGGKLDRKKNILELLQAANEIKMQISKFKLIVFGRVAPELEILVEKLIDDKSIIFIGWIGCHEVYNWYLASDLAIFPGTHSVLWEQALACGLPAVFRYWRGFEHLKIGKNYEFLKNGSKEDIKAILVELINNKEKYEMLKYITEKEGPRQFSYKDIALRAIGEEVGMNMKNV